MKTLIHFLLMKHKLKKNSLNVSCTWKIYIMFQEENLKLFGFLTRLIRTEQIHTRKITKRLTCF